MNEYSGKFPVYHLDLYRLESEEELFELGIEEFIENGITIIEWAELAKSVLPDRTITISFIFEDGIRKAVVDNLLLK